MPVNRQITGRLSRGRQHPVRLAGHRNVQENPHSADMISRSSHTLCAQSQIICAQGTLQSQEACAGNSPESRVGPRIIARRYSYRRPVTYTLAAEPGTSLRAAGWQAVAEVHGRSWSYPARRRPGAVKGEAKVRWERQLGERPAEPRAVWLGLAPPTEPAPLEALWAA